MKSLDDYLDQWDPEYAQNVRAIPLFDEKLAWSAGQKEFFARIFYHSRGHFYDFLWHLANIAPSGEYKEVVLANIKDEFGIGADGVNRLSHEKLYWQFAEALGLDTDTLIREELLGKKTDLPFIKSFNHGHLEWILTKPWDQVWSAFSAYERLDNIDYENLHRLAVLLGATGQALVFHDVHRMVMHYEAANPLLENIWRKDPKAVQAGFEFIGKHQLQMWRLMSDAVASVP